MGAIYQPKGKAAEYAEWACNFYTGCSNNCNYCYCKRGVLSSTWSDKPKLKTCFKNPPHAIKVFEKELKANIEMLKKHGLLFSFTTDPMLQETRGLTTGAIIVCEVKSVPVKILTKTGADSAIRFIEFCNKLGLSKNRIAYGVTLTGCDSSEPNASSNADRIVAMNELRRHGFKTWASIEPIISFSDSLAMIAAVGGFCSQLNIGLMSGRKYDKGEAVAFISDVLNVLKNSPAKIYFKDSLLSLAGVERISLPSQCVGREYNMFNDL